jgi:hypothetical protein
MCVERVTEDPVPIGERRTHETALNIGAFPLLLYSLLHSPSAHHIVLKAVHDSRPFNNKKMAATAIYFSASFVAGCYYFSFHYLAFRFVSLHFITRVFISSWFVSATRRFSLSLSTAADFIF